MSGGGGGGGLGGFVEDAIDTVQGGASSVWGGVSDAWDSSGLQDATDKLAAGAYDLYGSVKDDPLMTLGTLGLFSGATQLVTAPLQTGQRIIDDLNDQAMGDAQKEAARAEDARAAAIAALPKDPTVEEIQRQRRATGGRRGTILTAPGQSLGSVGQGKNLLGL